jgi:hypothetical protein
MTETKQQDVKLSVDTMRRIIRQYFPEVKYTWRLKKEDLKKILLKYHIEGDGERTPFTVHIKL